MGLGRFVTVVSLLYKFRYINFFVTDVSLRMVSLPVVFRYVRFRYWSSKLFVVISFNRRIDQFRYRPDPV